MSIRPRDEDVTMEKDTATVQFCFAPGVDFEVGSDAYWDLKRQGFLIEEPTTHDEESQTVSPALEEENN